ncbi:protein FAM200C-like [Tachypleus tridentatus]|uniref:protein FAM200C-like n=1 Tax=Tachypleus tridentatus TaxID=6853 RepID=UPI003FD26B5C
MSKKRKWNDEYVKFGFTCTTEKDGTQRPQCILCSTLFSNANLKPSKLDEYFKNKHGGRDAGNDIVTLRVKRARFDQVGTLPTYGFLPTEKHLLRASYEVAYQIAKSKKPHTIGEELIKPCALEMAKIVLGKEAEKKLQQVSLSNDVIHNRIIDMSVDILEQVVADIKASPVKISLQVDESTDVSNCCQLLAVVRYVKEKKVEESFLFCQSLKTTAQAIDVFNKIQEFFSRNGLHLDKIGSICTDGAPAMLGNRSGFAALMRKEVPNLKITHCFLHRHSLAAKTLPPDLKKTLDICVKVINFIRSRALNHRLFQSLCEEMGQEHTVLLYHTEVRWLSRGRVLFRVFELRGEIHQFLRERVQELAIYFKEPSFVQMLAYLADVFLALNELNLSLQGRGLNIVTTNTKLAAFKEKLVLWIKRVKMGNLANFPCLEETVTENSTLHPDFVAKVVEHMQMLPTSFEGYFSCGELQTYDNWILNPFMQNLEDVSGIKDDLIDLRHNREIQMEFTNSQLEHFWASQLEAYPALAKKALEVLVPFATTYLSEQGFSCLLHIQTKCRNRLNSEHDMRVALSTKTPRFDAIIEKKQQQRSH